jgi:hypothetical protein
MELAAPESLDLSLGLTKGSAQARGVTRASISENRAGFEICR